MIEDKQIKEACNEVDMLLLSETNRKAFKDVLDALIQLAKEKKALQAGILTLTEETSITKRRLCRWRILAITLIAFIIIHFGGLV